MHDNMHVITKKSDKMETLSYIPPHVLNVSNKTHPSNLMNLQNNNLHQTI